ncbi:hypothetical protein HY68_30545 [Streptomyces sp. AcH 505]|uniref:hypothetical protein n=1 Tax=Streptomyces sp. AcH 505 TaxID=352211 RepID=UPI000591E592|nr:hypothetical protein HY68_30545 [Streptomyces sp. AcH 505]
MDIARQLALVELLRTRDFPAERGGSGTVTGGPGYHLAALSTSEEFWDDDGSGSGPAAEQYEALGEALAGRLDARWGPAQRFSLWSMRARGMAGEELPEPWYELSAAVDSLWIWRTENRWTAIGVAHRGAELPYQLMALITETDPP